VAWVNKAMAELMGYFPADALVGKPCNILFSKEEHFEALRRSLCASEQMKAPLHLETKWLHRTKGEFDCRLVISSVEMPGVGSGVLVAAWDVSDRRKVDQALRESEAKYRQLVDHAPVGIYEIDFAQYKITSVNDVICEVTGYSREEMLAMNPMGLLCKESQALLFERMRKIADGEKLSTTAEFKILTKDGREIWALMNSKFLYKDGIPIKAAVVAHDITERKKLEEQLFQSQKMEAIGRLAGGVAHDFNNLLTIIIGNADLLRLKFDVNSEVQEILEEICKAGDRAASLTQQLLAFSRKQVLQPKTLSLNLVIMEMEKMLIRLIGEDVEFKTWLEPELGLIFADQGQVQQVILNMVVNARDAMPRGGALTLETRNLDLDESSTRDQTMGIQPGSYIMVSVSDTGSGIDPSIQQRIFEPFFTTKEMGTGLGLSTVYGIMKQSGGLIQVESEAQRGTTFKLLFPRTQKSVQKAAEKSSQRSTLRGNETLLLVEDDAYVRRLAIRVLESYGYSILEAKNAQEALDILERFRRPIHLLLTDVIIPGKSGAELAQEVQARYKDIKVLFMSGYTDDSPILKKILSEGVTLIRKPFSPEDLAEMIRTVLDDGSQGL
jgi:two-component system, cell cycle sensor histidine kinase and response regulator CckA